MSGIDWSKAPDWAHSHGLVGFQGITELWFNDDQYAVVGREGGPYPWGGGTGDTRHNHSRSHVQYITRRPARWDGKGLPPVGVICEYHAGYVSEPPEYKACEIIAHFGGESAPLAAYVFTQHDGTRLVGQGTEEHFRPTRTPEQIAEDKRLHEIRNALTAINAKVHFPNDLIRGNILAAAVEAMIDAGYRKQEAS